MSEPSLSEIVKLAKRHRLLRAHGIPDSQLITLLRRYVTAPEGGWLRHVDLPEETMLDFFLGRRTGTRPELPQEVLRGLVEKITSGAAENDSQQIELILAFEENCRNPAGMGLIFFPEQTLGLKAPTPDEIVKHALRKPRNGRS